MTRRPETSPPASGTQASGITPPAGTISPAAATRSRGARNQPANQARDVREVAAAGTTLAIAAAMSEDRGPDSLDAHVRRLMKDLGLWGYHPWRRCSYA